MKKFTIELNVGDKIDLGRFKNVRSEIKDIKLDDHDRDWETFNSIVNFFILISS